MAIRVSLLLLLVLLIVVLLPPSHQQQQQQQPLDPSEQNSVYLALESVNPNIPWRSLYPDDLCLLSSPHGVLCAFFPSSSTPTLFTPHVIELNFGVISDSAQNPPCTPHSHFPSDAFSLPHLRKLFFYRCFSNRPVSFPILPSGFGSDLEELVLIENPSLSGSLGSIIGNFTSLKRLILTGSNVSGGIPDEITTLPSLQQLTLSGNTNLRGGIPVNTGMLGGNYLRVLDLSNNGLNGTLPDSLGKLHSLIKLDLAGNMFSGEIPASFKGLQKLEFLDLSYNRFGNFGVPLFVGSMPSLREIHLSGNKLGGTIPEIWDNLQGILGIGLSGVGLVGNIPPSMGVFLTNLSYILLDNNKLEGEVPEELGLLQNVKEVNLRNNHLSGKIPFSALFVAKVGSKLKLEGNPSLCVDKIMKKALKRGSLGNFNFKPCIGTQVPNPALVNGGVSLKVDWFLLILLGVFWSFL